MPYIANKDNREQIDETVYKIGMLLSEKGNLNYFLCKLFTEKKISYEEARNFIGDLECAKLEIYRRWIAPYEDKKKEENGDV